MGKLRYGIDEERLDEVRQRALARFRRAHPRCLSHLDEAAHVMPHGVPMAWMAQSWPHPPVVVDEGHGAWFTCLDGVRFLDTNIGDKSTFCGLDPQPVVRAVAERVRRGWQFLLPTADAAWVAAELARRWGLPAWQFTLSATQANAEAVRLARHATGRRKVLYFYGNYAGHGEEMLTPYSGGGVRPDLLGLAPGSGRDAGVVPFNDLEALEAELKGGEYACLLGEPALTNEGVVLPELGFHDGVRRLTREAGTMLVLDETHTLIAGPGGLVREWGLEPDMVTAGKAIGGGVALGVYGMSAALAEAFERGQSADGRAGVLATGGTLFGNALSMAAARAALAEVLTDEAYARTRELGGRLAGGLEAAVSAARLPWTVVRLFARANLSFADPPPRDAAAADRVDWPELRETLHLLMAERGVWDALASAGPAVSVAATTADVDHYLAGFGETLDELTGPAGRRRDG
jgi:glutamate-1-semialdehyde aminotransferase